ncbi:MAG TPA: tetratricopeptide repeat protein [Gemmatimonadota bacterium]|nr:tetratricopeptide repeat protein [Gemmatimonadota bacterium]
MKSYQQLFAELKRRHVFRVAAIYGVVSFGVLQAADLMLPRLGLPDWTVTFMVALVVLAFPVVLIIAWAFEVTPEGVKRTAVADDAEVEAIIAAPASQRWPAGLLALVGVVALFGGGWWIGLRTADEGAAAVDGAAAAGSGVQLAMAEAEEDTRPSIAVFPFADMSPEQDQEYFSDGISEELLNALAKIRELRVAARTSAFAFKGQDLTAQQLGDTLQVRYLVEGSVRKAGDRLRITAQLIDTQDGSHLWSEQYDRTLDDVFAIQTEIAEAIADQLRVSLGLDEGADLVSPTDDLEAYDLYLAARGRMRERGDGVAEAIRLYEAAIARDSSWAPAWAGLAESRATLPWYLPGRYADRPWAENLDAAERAAHRALSLDSAIATAWVALGNVHRERWEWREATDSYARALELDPESAEAYQQYAEFLAYVGRLDEALEAARQAVRLDRAPVRLNVAAYVLTYEERYDEGLTALDEGDALDPEDRFGRLGYTRFRLYLDAGRWADARNQIPRMRGVHADMLRGGVPLWPAGPPTPEFAAYVSQRNEILGAMLWMKLGEPGRAVEAFRPYLDRDYGERNSLWTPTFRPLLDTPLFRDILRKSNLEGARPRVSAPGEVTP